MHLCARESVTSLPIRVASCFRVARRYLIAGQLGVGDTVQNERIRIHRYRDSIKVTDLTNAGKRGKRVEQFDLSPAYGPFGPGGDRMSWLDQTGADLVNLASRGYDAVLKYVKDLDPRSIELSESKLRGVDVEPHGDKFRFESPLPEGGSIRVESSPLTFMVVNHAPMRHPRTGEPMNTFQDTSYWPRKKADAAVFYAWMKGNHSKAKHMSIDMFKDLWHHIGVNYDSH